MQVQKQNYKQTELGEIPEEWNILKGIEIFDIYSGSSVSNDNLDRNGDVLYVQVEDMNLRSNSKWIVDSRSKLKNQLKIPILDPNSVIFPKRGAAILTNKVRILKKNSVVDPNVMVLKCKDSINYEFLYYNLINFKLHNIMENAGLPQLNNKDLYPRKFIVPPIQEQQTIASILSNVDNLIQKTDQAIEQTQRLKKGLMQRLLTKGIGHTKFKKTELGEISEDWQLNRLIDVCVEKPCYGAAISAIPKDKNLPRYVRITDLDEEGHLNDDDWVSISVKDAKPYLLNEGEFLFARTGATVGKTYLYRKQDGECAFAGYLIRFIPDKTKLDPQFLFYYTHSIFYWKWLRSIQTEGVQPNVNASQYSNMIMPIPPIEEQQAIISILSKIDELIQTLKVKKAGEETLKKGLMQQLLTGKVRVKV